MNLARRIGVAVVVAGGSAGASAALLPHGGWFVAAALLILAWKVSRDAYLSRWQVHLSDEKVKLAQRGGKRAAVPYEEITRVQHLWPSIRLLSSHLLNRPNRERLVGGEMVRMVVPAGTELAQVVRRLWTASWDVLIQARSGRTLLVPLAALDGDTKRSLWTQLHLRAPREAFKHAPELLEQAFAEEKAADELMMGHNRREAQVRFHTAAVLWEQAGVIESAARCLRHESNCLITLGHFTEAGGVATRALRMAKELGDARNVAEGLNQLAGVAYRVSGEEGLRHSLRYLSQAASLHQQLHQPFLQARMLSNAAIIAEQAFRLRGEEQHLAASRRFAEQALEILRSMPRANAGVHVRMQEANVLGTLARCEFHRRNWRWAAKLFESVDSKWSASDKIIADDLAMWGRVLFKLSQDGGAHPGELRYPGMLHEALQKLGQAVLYAQADGDLSELLLVYALRGDTFWEMGNWKAAVADYEAAMAFLADALAFRAPFDRAGLLRRYSRLYRAAAEGLMRMAQEDPEHAQERLELAFRYCEECRARNLAEMMRLSDNLEGRLPDPLHARLGNARRQLQRAYVRMEAVQKGEAGLRALGLQDAWLQLAAAQKQLAEVQRDIARQVPQLESLVSPSLPTLSAVRSWLPATGAGGVLELAVGESCLCVFLITRDAPLTETCFLIDGLGEEGIAQVLARKGWLRAYDEYAGKRAEHDELVRQHFFASQQHSEAATSSRADLGTRIKNLQDELDELRERWKDLLPDVIEQIGDTIFGVHGSCGSSISGLISDLGIERLAIIPDGLLHRLPLHAAVGHVREVTYAPSSAILVDAVRRVVTRPERALVANPEPLKDKDNGGPSLFCKEADRVEALACRGNVTRLDWNQADRAAVLQGMRGCSLFHFAGHAASDLRSPLDSCLKVARIQSVGETASEESWQSGFLRCKKLMSEGELPRGAWVVLAGCETGVTPPDLSGEYLGLPGAFLLAGAGLVVSTLWEVDGASTVEVIDRFYRGVFGCGLSPAEAMQCATTHLRAGAASEQLRARVTALVGFGLETRSTVAHRHDAGSAPTHPFSKPFYWAPFVVCGAPWNRTEVEQTQMETVGTPAAWALPVQTAVGRHPKMNELMKRGSELTEKGLHEQVIGVLEQCLREFGPTPELHDGLGNSYAEVGNVEKAIAHYREALRFEPNSFVLPYQLGCVYRDYAHVPEARQAFRAALRINPVYAKALCNLATLTNDPGEALSLLQEAGRIDPDDPDVPGACRMWEKLAPLGREEILHHRLYWASKDFEEGRFREAKRHLALSREGDLCAEDRAFSFKLDSEIFRQEGRIGESVAALEEAVRLDPGKPHYWNNLGARRLLLCHDRDWPPEKRTDLLESAAAAARKAIALRDYARPHWNLADSHFMRRELETAKVEAGNALAMARRQLASGAGGELVCGGCTTEGKMPEQCEQCVKKAQNLLRDIDLATGDYRVA